MGIINNLSLFLSLPLLLSPAHLIFYSCIFFAFESNYCMRKKQAFSILSPSVGICLYAIWSCTAYTSEQNNFPPPYPNIKFNLGVNVY